MFEEKKYFTLIAEAHDKPHVGLNDIEHVIGENDFHILLEVDKPTKRVYHLVTKTFALELTAMIELNQPWSVPDKTEGTWEKGFNIREITKHYHKTRNVGIGDALMWIDNRMLNFV